MRPSSARLVTRRTCLRVLGLGSAATLLAACSPAAAPAPTTAPPAPTQPAAAAAKPTTAPAPAAAPTTPPAAAAATTTAPAQTGTSPAFRVDELSDTASLNPLIFNSTPTRRRAVLVFSSLYQYDASNNLVPDLASSMPQMPDPQTYIVPLRSNVRFHSGKQMTADDVKFTYDTLLMPDYGAIWRSAVSAVLDSITVQDANTVVFKLNKPFGPFLTKLALIPIVNSEQSKDQLNQQPDGTGPFKFVAYQQGSVMQMARNDAYYFSELKPVIGELSIYVVPENATRYANLANGITQLAPEPAFGDLDLLKGKGVVINSVRAPASTYGYINMKRADGPMTDKNLRRALAFAMDRSAIVQNIWAGQGIPGQVFIRPELWAFDPNYKPFSDTPDVTRAKAELAQSPHAGDRFVITTANDDVLSGTAALIQSAGKAAGLNVDIGQLDRAAFGAELGKDDWDILLTDSYTGSNSGLEPDSINSLFVTNASANFGKYSNPEMDQEVAAAVFATSHEDALPHYKRVMEIDAEDIPILTVAYHNYVEALSSKVQNYKTSPLAQYDLRTASLG
ncbi:MAG: ABC transporter substrate-binding protein [Chloroflexi bacterium]|nr:ABC transporter substrate-binding protein [Chloroflexota bacterium]MBV9601984.1 ABC transporter substrate-binding protein [Chloroflexota bacterium]